MLEIPEKEFLNLRRLPACISLEQAAWLLGISVKAAAHLVSIGLLRVLGHPRNNAPKALSSEYVLALSHDEKWLARASDSFRRYNFDRNHQTQSAE
jgi:hypothetical protein